MFFLKDSLRWADPEHCGQFHSLSLSTAWTVWRGKKVHWILRVHAFIAPCSEGDVTSCFKLRLVYFPEIMNWTWNCKLTSFFFSLKLLIVGIFYHSQDNEFGTNLNYMRPYVNKTKQKLFFFKIKKGGKFQIIKKDATRSLKMTKNTQRSLQVRCHLERNGLWGRVEQVIRILPASPSAPSYTPRGARKQVWETYQQSMVETGKGD